MKISTLTLIVTVTALSGCVTTPQVLQGEFSTISPTESKINHVMNHQIRWSGLIVQTINNKDKTCFEIIQTEVNKSLRPKKTIAKNGSRFLACKDGFLEPHAFDKRLVTITGNLVAYTEKDIGEYAYEYPVVKTDLIYIWQNRRPPTHHYNFNYGHHRIGRFSCRYSYMPGYCY